jgi:hypothetical protein
VTLHDVTMTKTDSTGTGSRPQIRCPGAPLTLAPQQTATCTATYRITQADVDQTRFSDTAQATGRAPDGRTVHAAASAVVQAPPRPALTLAKTASPARAAVGEMVRYTFAITNVGNNTLHNITVIEQKFTGSGHWSAVRCPAGPGATVTCTASYMVTAADAAAGTIVNTAVARGHTSHGRVFIDPPAVTAPARSRRRSAAQRAPASTTTSAASRCSARRWRATPGSRAASSPRPVPCSPPSRPDPYPLPVPSVSQRLRTGKPG